MKLRFGVEVAAQKQIRSRLEALCEAPPVGRRIADVYLDTPDGALAAKGVALRFRRRTVLGDGPAGRPSQRQEIWPKGAPAGSIKKLGIPRLKQRLDATFTVRTLRWTWRPRGGWAVVSLDRSEVSTGAAREAFTELRIVCKRKRADAAMRLAVELGAMHLSSMRVRERGMALLGRMANGLRPSAAIWKRSSNIEDRNISVTYPARTRTGRPQGQSRKTNPKQTI